LLNLIRIGSPKLGPAKHLARFRTDQRLDVLGADFGSILTFEHGSLPPEAANRSDHAAIHNNTVLQITFEMQKTSRVNA
jgi:hypothetical protein